jgi:ABC-type sugar transport system permease subunit
MPARPLRVRARYGASGRRTWLLAYLFVAPAAVLTAVFSLVPLGMLAYRSLYQGNVFGTELSFAGLANYRAMFSQGGGHALGVTAEYTIGFVVLAMALGLGIALLLNARLRGVARVRAAFIIPLVVPVTATALIWSNLFAPHFGLVNRALGGLGLPQVDFLSSPTSALLTVLTFGTWQFFGENVILYLAALKSLPLDVIEAASVDGAGAWRRFRRVQWPLLRRATILIGVITTLTGLQTFTQIYVLTGGGPDGATQTALYYEYNEGFVRFNTGQADAMGVVLFAVSLLITLAQVSLLGRSVEDD